MGAHDLLVELGCAGLTATADGDRLVIRPASRLTDDIRSSVREAKAELLALLSGEISQPGHAYQARGELDAALAVAINRACDVRGDDDVNRAALLAECALLPSAAQADAFEHFTLQAAGWRAPTVAAVTGTRCTACRHYRPGRCGRHAAAGLSSPMVGADLAGLHQNCPAFQAAEVQREGTP